MVMHKHQKMDYRNPEEVPLSFTHGVFPPLQLQLRPGLVTLL